MDRIRLTHVVAHGRHGADPGERDRAQPFHIDLDLDLDLSHAAQSDSLEDTVDYAHVHHTIVDIVERESFVLLERLAATILRAVMEDERILGARIEIAKPQLLGGATPSVVLSRGR